MRKAHCKAIGIRNDPAGLCDRKGKMNCLHFSFKNNLITTLYDRDIHITGGKNATCYIGNSEANYYEDMWPLSPPAPNLHMHPYCSICLPRNPAAE